MQERRGNDRSADDRRKFSGLVTRGKSSRAWTLLFRFVRLIASHVQNVYATFGLFLLAGALIAVTLTWGFAELAGNVRSGSTQAFDDAVMRFIGAHQNDTMRAAMLEVTSLGTAVVVLMIVLVAGAFLWLNKHKHSALLLGIATGGGIGLNMLLKIGFNRPRPQIFEWGTHAASSSFPSGHAMSAAIVYSTVAYLVARLQPNHLSRLLTMALAGIMVVLICASRLYLGVHYPSDVLAGVTIGLAWAAFCMAVLEMAQLYARRNAPEMLETEHPAPAPITPMPAPMATAVTAGIASGVAHPHESAS